MRFRIFYILLLTTYPIIALLPRDQTTPNVIWGIIGFIIVVIDILININKSSISKSNIFIKVAFVFVLIMSLSILLSRDVNLNKWNNVLKFTLPLFIASMLYSRVHKKDIKKIYYISGAYTLGIFLFLIFKIYTSGASIATAMINRDSMWYDKPYALAINYTTILLLFVFLSNILNKNTYWKYIFFIPVYFLTSRTTIIGISLFLIFQILADFKGFRGYFIIFISLVFLVFSYLANHNFKSSVNNTFISLITSEKDLKEDNKNFSQDTFSSGRTNIYRYYFNNLTFKNILTGNGMSYYNTKTDYAFRLHNDFLEFFFSFGIFGFLTFLIGVSYKIFFKPIIKLKGKWRLFFIGFFLYFFSMSIFTSVMDYQNIVYLYLIIILLLKIKITVRSIQ